MFKFINTVKKIATIKPIREFVYKLVKYYRNDKRFDKNEIIDLLLTLTKVFGIKIVFDANNKNFSIDW